MKVCTWVSKSVSFIFLKFCKDAVLIKANFENAFLIKTDFTNAFLMEAKLRGCHVTGATFANANLYKAELRGIQGLDIDSLTKAKTLFLAKFDEDLLQKLMDSHPHLMGKEALSFN